MRRARFILAASSLAVMGGAIWASGCSTFHDDCLNGVCPPFENGNVDLACPGDPTADPTLVTESCGLFVRGGPTDTDEAGVGTLEKPFKTLQAALNVVTGKFIFVCTANPFNEKVLITKNKVAVYGGFDCSNGWAWKAGTKSTLLGPADEIALTISSQGVKVENFRIQAAKAIKPEGSSIAVLVNSADPSFTRCEMIADQALKGVDGEGAQVGAAADGTKGQNGKDACSADGTVLGGKQIASAGCTQSSGGQGGDGNVFSGNDGGPGQPQDTKNAGKAGIGEPADDPSWDCNVGSGQIGANGDPGQEGDGAKGELYLGTLTEKGFTPASGKSGTPGQPGQGGGGGGSAKGAACPNGMMKKGGASGGSGGSGGCGGEAGEGGKGAGASIALISLESPAISLTDVSLTAANGADGGAGGTAQDGGKPGAASVGGNGGGFGVKAGCPGGAGGVGGRGGPGGGGRGGHSTGLAYTGKPPAFDPQKVTIGTAGRGGLGGNTMSNSGEDGIAEKSLDLTPKP